MGARAPHQRCEVRTNYCVYLIMNNLKLCFALQKQESAGFLIKKFTEVQFCWNQANHGKSRKSTDEPKVQKHGNRERHGNWNCVTEMCARFHISVGSWIQGDAICDGAKGGICDCIPAYSADFLHIQQNLYILRAQENSVKDQIRTVIDNTVVSQQR